jgi:hypothetical protein
MTTKTTARASVNAPVSLMNITEPCGEAAGFGFRSVPLERISYPLSA